MEIDPLYETQIATVSEVMGISDQPESIQIEYRIDRIVSDLDELCALARDGKVNDYAAGQILTRAQLICSFLEARKQPKLKVIHGQAK